MSRVIEVARSWLGTTWMHGQRVKGIGVDCVGFLFAVASECGYDLPPLPSNYERIALKDSIREYLNTNLIAYPDIVSEAVLLFQYSGFNNHVAIATSTNSIIHASYTHQKVVEHPLDGVWLRTLKGVWIYPEKV